MCPTTAVVDSALKDFMTPPPPYMHTTAVLVHHMHPIYLLASPRSPRMTTLAQRSAIRFIESSLGRVNNLLHVMHLARQSHAVRFGAVLAVRMLGKEHRTESSPMVIVAARR